MPTLDIVAQIIVIAIIALFPPLAMIRTLRRVPFGKTLAKSSVRAEARLEKYRRVKAESVIFPRWYRVFTFVVLVGALIVVLGIPLGVLVYAGKVIPFFFPSVVAVLPAGAEYFITAYAFVLACFFLMLLEPVLMRLFPHPMAYLTAQSLVNNPFLRSIREEVKDAHVQLERIAGAFDLAGYSNEYMRARTIGFFSAVGIALVGTALAFQGALVVREQGVVFRGVVTSDKVLSWEDIESITITSRAVGDDGVEPAFFINSANDTKNIWAIDSLTRVGDALIAVCAEARLRNIPIVITSQAARVTRLPLTSADNARVLTACALE